MDTLLNLLQKSYCIASTSVAAISHTPLPAVSFNCIHPLQVSTNGTLIYVIRNLQKQKQMSYRVFNMEYRRMTLVWIWSTSVLRRAGSSDTVESRFDHKWAKKKKIRASIKETKGQVSKQTVVLRRWGLLQDNLVLWTVLIVWIGRRKEIYESLYGGHFTWSTKLIKPNHPLKGFKL